MERDGDGVGVGVGVGDGVREATVWVAFGSAFCFSGVSRETTTRRR